MATKTRPVPDVDDEVERMARVYLDVFSTPSGQIVLADLRKSFASRRSFVEGDPYSTAFREGQRDVLLAIEDLLSRARDPEKFRMTVETE
jgi:hypothetical protein